MNSTFTVYDERDPQSMQQFADEFEQTEVGKEFFAMYGPDTVESAWDLAIEKYRKVRGNEPIALGDFVDFVDALLLSGGLQRPAAPAPKEKKLSPSQQKWSEYRVFSEEHSMSECRARAQQDSAYASFMHKNFEREAAENRDPNGLVSLNANRTPTKKGVPADVVAYAERYRTMSSDAVRRELSPGMNPLGPAAAAEANRLFQAGCDAGLI